MVIITIFYTSNISLIITASIAGPNALVTTFALQWRI